jgi:hypothetical protein
MTKFMEVKMNETQIKQHVRILGMVQVLNGSLSVLVGILVFAFLGGFGVIVDDPIAFQIFGLTGLFVGAFLLVLSTPGIIASYGLLKQRPWARSLAIAVGILQLMLIPIGTIIGIYTIFVLAQASAETYFASLKPA